MIKIERLDNSITLSMQTGVGYTIPFKFERITSLDAILLANHLQDQLHSKIEKIRRDAYNLGWKEGRSKKCKKRDWFNGNINSEYV